MKNKIIYSLISVYIKTVDYTQLIGCYEPVAMTTKGYPGEGYMTTSSSEANTSVTNT